MNSGVVSYDLFFAKFGAGSNGFTSEGGYFQTFINNTGISVKGTIVIASVHVDNAVDTAPANTSMPIGVIYESGVPNGSPVKVVVYGKAQVLLKDGETAACGYWCGMSDTNGRMYQTDTFPGTTEHVREIGHSLETISASGTNILSFVQLHFN